MLPATYQIPAAIVLLFGGTVACFFGYRLFRIVLGQTLLLAALGTVAGYLLFLVGSRILVSAMPQFLVELPTATLGAVVVAAGAMALLAAIVPARRVGRLDPASVYRG